MNASKNMLTEPLCTASEQYDALDTRFAIVSPSDLMYEGKRAFTLCEAGDMENFRKCIKEFLVRDISSIMASHNYNHKSTVQRIKKFIVKDNSDNGSCATHVPCKLRVYSFSDEKPLDIDTSEMIFDTRKMADIVSLELPWKIIKSESENSFAIECNHGHKIIFNLE